VLVLALAPLGFVLGRCATSHGIPFLRPSASAPWITPDVAVTARLQQWGRDAAPVARFERRFQADADARAELRVRALRRFRLQLNGRLVAEGDGSRWRDETRVDLGGLLREGENALRVEVSNAHGPPLLSLRIEGLGAPLRSDERWSASLDGVTRPARIADDTRIDPTSLATETPREALIRRADGALLLFLLGALGCLAVLRLAPRAQRALPALVLVAASVGWAALFGAKVSQIPLAIGFDARHHLAYVEWMRSERSLPLATDGWSTFHPPLFYAAALALGESRTALRALPFFAGLVLVFAVFSLARRFFPDDPRRQALAAGFAAVLPMHVYSASYFSNESLHTLLASLAILATVDAILAERASAGRAALVGLLYGLAALVKFTVLLVVPVAALALAACWWGVRRLPLRRIAVLAAAALLPFAGVAGWFYARNWWVFGDPLMANWGDMPGAGHVWWQHPGFHTPAYYTRFGEALVHPYLAGFHSFWDSVYSTFWGDGFVAGRVRASDRHGFWSYDWMSMGYWVALPATGLLALGALDAARAALREDEARRRTAFAFLLGATWVVGLGFVYLTLRLPFFAQAKATYTLVLAGPLAVFFALGAGRLDAGLALWTPARALLWGWLALFAGTLFLGFAG
jgi:hypothetical protein